MAYDTMMYHHVHHYSNPAGHTNNSAASAAALVGGGGNFRDTTTLIKSASVRSKRKSAVELLAETKPLYVKSECVRDREQALPQRCAVSGTTVILGQGYGTYQRSKSIGAATAGGTGSTAVAYVSGRQGGGQVSTVMMPQQYMAVVSPSRSLPPLSHHTTPHHQRHRTINAAALVTAPPVALSPGYQPAPPPPVLNTSDLLQTRLRQLLVHCTPSPNTATIATESSNGATGTGSMREEEQDEEPDDHDVLLSPPAEYATATPLSVTCGGGSGTPQQQRCHKSLPDLHCSRGGEPSSNKSSNKSMSNRDSGGSSGHYTQHSEPPPPPPPRQQEVRRDSGSSTQHSNASSSFYCCQEAECRVAARQQYHPATTVTTYHQPLVLQQPQHQQQQYAQQMRDLLMQRDVGATVINGGYGGVLLVRDHTTAMIPVQQQPTPATVSSLQPPPPPVTFKRQKCLRYKRDKPILRSKSDISDRYWRPPEQPPISHLEQFFEHLGLTSDRYEDMFSMSGRSSASPVFFSDVSTVDSSAPQDAIVSTGGGAGGVDYIANRQQHEPGGAGCISTTTATFRPNEPPSIVERNARIIKWLCHCRKAQML